MRERRASKCILKETDMWQNKHDILYTDRSKVAILLQNGDAKGEREREKKKVVKSRWCS